MRLVVQQPGAREIKVKLMLAGGHSAMLSLPPEHPLLAQLLASLAAPANDSVVAPPSLYQIPIDGGRASLTFASRQLVGLMTDPAVLVQWEEPRADAPASPTSAAELTLSSRAPSPAASIDAPAGGIVRHPVVQLDDFLTSTEVALLMDTVFSAEGRFVPSAVSDQKSDYRYSLVLNPPYEVAQMMIAKIRAVMPQVIPKLKMALFPVGEIECQLTAHTVGSFFRVHTRRRCERDDQTAVYLCLLLQSRAEGLRRRRAAHLRRSSASWKARSDRFLPDHRTAA